MAAAYERRSGIPQAAPVKAITPDLVRAMPTELFLDFLAIRVDSRKAENMAFKINLVSPDNGEKFAIEMSNATLTNIPGMLAENPDLTITANRADLEILMAGTETFEALVKSGKIKLEGDAAVLNQLKSVMEHFEITFEILPGTKAKPSVGPEMEPFEQESLGDSAGG